MQLLDSRALSSNTLVPTFLILTLLALGGRQSKAVCFLTLRLKFDARYQNYHTHIQPCSATQAELHNSGNNSV